MLREISQTQKKNITYFLLFVVVNRIKIVWMSDHLVYSYKCCFTDSYHTNDNILFFRMLKKKKGTGQIARTLEVLAMLCS